MPVRDGSRRPRSAGARRGRRPGWPRRSRRGSRPPTTARPVRRLGGDQVERGRHPARHALGHQPRRPRVGPQRGLLERGDRVRVVGRGRRTSTVVTLTTPSSGRGGDGVGPTEVERLGVVELGQLLGHRAGQPRGAREERRVASGERVGVEHGSLPRHREVGGARRPGARMRAVEATSLGRRRRAR